MEQPLLRPWAALYDSQVAEFAAPRFPTVLHPFLAACRERPQQPFLYYGERTVSWREADEASDALAAAFAQAGVAAGDRIAIYLQSVPQFVLAVLAAWKLSAVVATVNPMYRERELAEVLHDSGARVLLCDDGDDLEPTRRVAADCAVAQVIACARDGSRDEFEAVLERAAGRTSAPGLPRPEDEATFIYTSGTTGPMKAAVSTHAQLAWSADVYRTWAAMTTGDVIVAIAPLVHVTGMVGYIALALAAQCPLVLTYRFTPAAFRDAVRRHRGTFTIGPTTAFVALAAAEDVTRDDLASLAKCFSGGAPIPAAVVERYRAKFGPTILGIYGLTEATGPTHMVPRGRPAPVDPATGTLAVGIPVPGLDCELIDEFGCTVPAGTPGEVALRGPQIASGYWRRSVETAATFTQRGLRTGDIGTMDAAGWLYVIDRKKDQINASGFKVWPREVEDVLYEHEAVLECAVVGVPDDYRGESVRAYVALHKGKQAGAGDLESFCRARMAAYKVPRSYVFLPELPKTASGKVLRRSLREIGP